MQILQQSDAMVASMRRLVNDEQATFIFGVVPANFHGNLATITRQFRQALPRVDMRIFDMNSVEQGRALLEGRIDAGISRIEIPVDGIERIVLREEGLTLESLKDEPFLVYNSAPRPSLADYVLDQVHQRGIMLLNLQEVDQYDTALIMIAAGCGVSIVPAAARMVAATGVAYRTLLEAITFPIVLCHRQSDTSPERRTLYFVLTQFLAEQGYPVPGALQDGVAKTA